MDSLDLGPEEAKSVLDRVDQEQKAFFRTLYGKKTAESGEFDLVINRDHIQDSRIAAQIISLAYDQKFGANGNREDDHDQHGEKPFRDLPGYYLKESK